MKNACIINVGVNASHGTLRSPIFYDKEFEFVPIPESGRRVSAARCPLLPTYSTLRTFSGIETRRFIPDSHRSKRVHNDPEFETYTYGDYPDQSPRASNLRKLREGDYLLFYARLVEYFGDKFTQNAAFYIIGIFEIEKIFRALDRAIDSHLLNRIKHNAHVKRALWKDRYWDGFWVFAGSAASIRFKRAIPIPIQTLFGFGLIPFSKPPAKKTENQVIGSYMRAARLVEWNVMRNYIESF